jgi:nucleotide-binding universal stress UspA family protein
VTKRKILIALDGSDFSRQILPQVQRFLKSDDTELLFFRANEAPEDPRLSETSGKPDESTVRQPYGPHPPDLPPRPGDERVEGAPFRSEIVESRRGDLEVGLHEVARPYGNAGFSTSVMVRFGDPAEEIIQAVEREDVDLVAMATHGKQGLNKLILGSVTEAVMNNVSIPMLVLRPEEEDAI